MKLTKSELRRLLRKALGRALEEALDNVLDDLPLAAEQKRKSLQRRQKSKPALH